MKSRLLIFGVVGLIGLIAVGAVAWYLISPLFINDVVDEAFPFEAPTAGELAAMSDDERAAMEVSFMDAVPDETELAALSADEMAQVEAKVMETAAMVMMDKDVQDDMMEAEWVVAGQGQFVGADSFHQGSGQATIFQQGDMSVLRFEDFMVTNGPDLHVLLATNPSPTGRADLGDYIDLGSLKGNLGNQNYEIPSDVDLSQYNSVVIYCMPFHVLFSAATIG
ncbi:MAG: DM13 domain-containing protein [Anaerolineae bacterium]|nr:DM13 domain-containing protein [Anaerolineae bacterium]